MEQQTFFVKNPAGPDREGASTVLVVTDTQNAAQAQLVDFYIEQGYNVHELVLKDTMFASVADFVTRFEQFTKASLASKEYVFWVVHYAECNQVDLCMYCEELTPKNSLLLKQAFASIYVHVGRQACVLLCPERCCEYSTRYLPKRQLEGMAIYTPRGVPTLTATRTNHSGNDNNVGKMQLVSTGTAQDAAAQGDQGDRRAYTAYGAYEEHIWTELEARLTTVRIIANHKLETRHVLGMGRGEPESPAAVPVEPDMDQEQVLRTLSRLVNADVAANLGPYSMSAMEYDEYVKRSGPETTPYLVLRRCILQAGFDKTMTLVAGAFRAVSAHHSDANQLVVLEQAAELAEAATQMAEVPVKLSNFPQLSNLPQVSSASSASSAAQTTKRSGPWKADVVEKPVAESGTHLDKMEATFIPPYMRAALGEVSLPKAPAVHAKAPRPACGTVGALPHTSDNLLQTPEELAELEKQVQEAAEHAQKMDAEYEKRQLTRDMNDTHSLMGFSMKERIPSKQQGGDKPM